MDHNHSLGILSQVDGVWVYVVLFLIILVQECGVPFPVLPSEVLLLGAGFLSSQGKVMLLAAGLVVMAATLIGNSLLYYIGRRFGRVALDRYGKYISLRPERVDRIQSWVERRGTPILIYGPLVPIMRAYIPALAGMFGVPFRFYITVLIGAALVWSFGLMILGQVLGNHWWEAVDFLRHNIRIGLLIAVLAVGIGLVALRSWRHLQRDRETRWEEAVDRPGAAGEEPAPEVLHRPALPPQLSPVTRPLEPAAGRRREAAMTVRLTARASELHGEE